MPTNIPKHFHGVKQPSKWIEIPCPCCNNMKKVINGQYLKNIRENAILDQREFGRLVGVSGPYISDIERNRRDITTEILEAYLKLE